MISWILILISFAYASPDWSRNAEVTPGEHRANIYEAQESEFKRLMEQGYKHINKWPVDVTGLLIPYEPLKFFLESDERNVLQNFAYRLSTRRIPFRDMEGLYSWLGLNPYSKDVSIDGVPRDFPMGAALIEDKNGSLGMTFSCATCHSQDFFGQTIVGLTNKRVRANEFFHLAKKYVPYVPSAIFQEGTNATYEERLMFRRTKYNLPPVGAKVPEALGLDTSLAQVAMSLARRNKDDYATRNSFLERFPRNNPLEGKHIADSKPATWWGLKYKTRWLSDGSIVTGNPIFTNFLWNELGRGTDLVDLEKWLQENQAAVEELTAFAFASEPPHYLDIFPTHKLDLDSAKRGETLFNNTCARCHGVYEKAWSLSSAENPLEGVELYKTTKVVYHKQTPVIDVGTDPGRYQGMQYFAEDLNRLKISRWMETVVEPQKGYVPPPLVGIFARYPYLHNNAIPNLCELLKPANERVKTFYQGPSDNADTDFDEECVGYPTGDKIPDSFKKDEDAFFNTARKGMSNMGHDKMFYDEAGRFKFSDEDRRDLIMFLKTL
jgi:mono/diheme cytochrome c family protein